MWASSLYNNPQASLRSPAVGLRSSRQLPQPAATDQMVNTQLLEENTGEIDMEQLEDKMSVQIITGPFDIQPGSYTSVTYHDAFDNEVAGTRLYVGPYVDVWLEGDYSRVYTYGQPNEQIDAILKNALGAQ